MQKLKIVFAGTPEFAALHLEAILDSHHHVLAVYTQPDRAAGRGNRLHPSPVKTLALSQDLPVFQPSSLRTIEAQQELAAMEPDLMVVVAYGLILPQAVLNIPRHGCINVHASLLPRWRGAAPIERALLAGDQQTGVTIMQMDQGLDTGAMLLRKALEVSASENRQTLEDRLAVIGREALVFCLDNLADLQAKAQQQDNSLSTYASKLDKSEALINWDCPAAIINRQIRCGIGRTPAYSFLAGERIRILEAEAAALKAHVPPGTIIESHQDSLIVACHDSALRISILQLPGKTPLRVREILNSRAHVFATGQRFSAEAPDPL
jgi:methionyl-tRNA formyltransferase